MQDSSTNLSFWVSLNRTLKPPVFSDDENKTRLARGLHVVLLTNMVIGLFYTLFIFITDERKLGALLSLSLIIGVIFPLLLLLGRGAVRLTSLLFVACLWGVLSSILFVGGGLFSVAGALYIPVLTITLLFLGHRASLIVLALTLAYTLLLNSLSLPVYFPLTKSGLWIMLAVSLVMIATPIDRMQHELMVAFNSIREQLSERQKAEHTLRDSEERFRLISSVTSDYTFSSRFGSDKSFQHDVYGGAFEAITGYTPDEFVKLGGWASIVHPDDREQDQRDMAMLGENKSVVTEVRIIRKDGQILWVRVYGYPLWNAAQQRLDGIYGAVQNINERKSAELALQESEKRYRVISEIISDYAYAYDIHPDDTFSCYWITEDSFKRLTGYAWSETGTSYKLYHPDDVQLVQQHVQQTIAGKATSGDYRIITKSSETRWIHIQRQVEWDEQAQRFVRFYGAAQDVTERKQAESALTQDRKLLRTVIDHLPDNIFVKDRDGRFLLNNSESMHILGVSNQEELLGKTDYDFFPIEQAQEWSQMHQKLMLAGKPVLDLESLHPWFPNGESRWILHSIIPLHDEQGAVTGLLGINRDVSARKQAENAIREKEALLRALLDASPDIAFLLSVEGNFLTVNNALAESIGSDIESLLGKSGFDFIGADLREERYRQFKRCIETRKPVRWEDGRPKSWWDNSFYPVLSATGEVEAVAVYSKDITEEKRLAAELQRYTLQLEQMVEERTAEVRSAKEQIELILNNTRDAIALARSNGDIETRNPAFIAMFGEHITNSTELLLRLAANDTQRASVSAALLNTIQQQEGQRVQLQIVSEIDGSKDIDLAFIPVQLTKTLERSGILLSAHDITHIKQIERFKTRFIDDAVHDLATPIAGLTNRLYLLKRSPENLDEHLQKLENQVGHLRNLLDDLRSLSQLDRGQLELQLDPYDLNDLVERVFDTYEPVAISKGQLLRLEATPNLPPVLVDNRQMERVFVNLVSNAINYSPNGNPITVRTWREDDSVLFSVTDSGIGIGPDDLQHIFDRFYRSERARAAQTAGTGLGLTISKEIVERHGGTITAESEVGKGSTFTIRLQRLS